MSVSRQEQAKNYNAKIARLKGIISQTNAAPTIVNPDSNFVVVTYWWGRGNLNQNTARPCISFFEEITSNLFKLAQIELTNVFKNNPRNKKRIIEYKNNKYNEFLEIVMKTKRYEKLLDKFTGAYIGSIKEHLRFAGSKLTHDVIVAKIEELKTTGSVPSGYVYKTSEEVREVMNAIFNLILLEIKAEVFFAFGTELVMSESKMQLATKGKDATKYKELINDATFKNTVKENVKMRQMNVMRIKPKLNAKKASYEHPLLTKYTNKSIYEVFIDEFRFLTPMRYEEMINKWENECRRNKCNYLAVEYPPFAEPGGYQLAINAKPMFIKKSLELCGGRSVLYIDGDMYIRKYPHIFDMPDIDFMARGWMIDPRSSYKSTTTRTYDPYKFETSGGTMMFSNSYEANALIDVWIDKSNNPMNEGKADDRILSMVFNSYKLVLPMKVIQLPIEYLWLSLDYDDRALEILYDYNFNKMTETIFIEHPECLTSEDTASGAGASSDRTPFHYRFIDGMDDVISESYHEFISFPNKLMADQFKDYHDWMKKATYLDDGNELLYAKGLVDPDDPDNNENMLYIEPYDKKYGNKKIKNEPGEDGEIYSRNEINERNNRLASSGSLSKHATHYETIHGCKTAILTPEMVGRDEMIPLILHHLNNGNCVVYNPSSHPDYDATHLNALKTEKRFINMDLVYSPIDANIRSFNDFYRMPINLSHIIMFKPCDVLMKYLSMFLNLQYFSNFIEGGNYQLISRIRVGLLNKQRKAKRNVDTLFAIIENKLESAAIADTMSIEPIEPTKKTGTQTGGVATRKTAMKPVISIGFSKDEHFALYDYGVSALYDDATANKLAQTRTKYKSRLLGVSRKSIAIKKMRATAKSQFKSAKMSNKPFTQKTKSASRRHSLNSNKTAKMTNKKTF